MARYLTKVRTPYNDSPSGQSKKSDELKMDARRLGRHSCLPPHQRSHIFAYTCASQPSVAETSTCNTIEASQADDQEWTNNIYNTSGQALARRSQQHTRSGCKLPVSPNWGALVQASFTGPTFGA
ncbi:hypothetical protein CK203_006680 [Vitis vinifera]|uniref:Uncharacterized protein n=1 Tax=Vitis vinifera TaxID=29760 RepID=A0A438KB75_VITVI|nr:hypothetical protein CK203_006680 [Vitis vinifera]